MSTSIEQRVVQMKFDNKQFESGVAQSMGTLDALEKKLDFRGAAKGFENISKAADQVSLTSLMSQTDEVGHKFDAMAVIAITALSRITNAAISAGTNLVKSLSIDQVSSGWSKYEARTAAVQTLVNATGKSVEDIERYMKKLMLYSDETSYGFQDMTQALSTMVSAGGNINKLVPLLEGFGNAVSYVGKGANEYSRAVYQLSQGYGRNALMLEDWKSIENTLGGAKQLKQVFIEVGEELGKIRKGELDIGSFNESLRSKWLDQDVMEEALGRFAEMTERAFAMIEAGEVETVSQAYEILAQTCDDYRIRAAKAAQEAKSFTEAIDATKDAVSTKWMESFQIIFGNYQEATELWTELTNALYDLFAASGDTRNEILSVWKTLGGREEMILAFKAAFEALSKPLGAVRDAIHEIFFPGSVDEKGTWLYKATKSVREFFEAITLSDEATYALKMTFKALLVPVYVLYQALRVVTAVTVGTIKVIFALGDALLSLPARLTGMENPLKRLFGDDRYAKLISSLTIIVNKLGSAFSKIGMLVVSTGKAITSVFSTKLGSAMAKLGEALRPIGEWILDRIVDGFELLARFDYSRITKWATAALDALVKGFGIILYSAGKAKDGIVDFFSSFFDKSPIEIIKSVVAAVENLKDNMVVFFRKLGIGDLFRSVTDAGGGLLDVIWRLVQAMGAFISRLTPAKILVIGFGASIIWVFSNLAMVLGSFRKMAGGVTNVLNGFTGVLKAFQQRLRGSPILQIAVAIGVLAISLGVLSQIDSDRLISAAAALAIVMGVFAVLVASTAIVSKFLVTSKQMAENLLKIAESMILMAGAVGILTLSIKQLVGIDLLNTIKGLFGIAAMLGLLVGAIKLIGGSIGSRFRDSIYIVALAFSLKTMVNALAKLSGVELDTSISNLAAIGIIIGLMGAITKATHAVKFSTGLGMIAIVGALLLFAKALGVFAQINFLSILGAFAKFVPIVYMLKAILVVLGEEDKALKSAGALAAMSASLLVLYLAVKKFGQLDLGVLVKGTAAVGALMLFVAGTNAIAKLGGEGKGIGKLKGSFVALAAAILILGVAINYIGGLSLGVVMQGTIVVSALLGLMTLLGKAIGKTKKASKTVIAMTVCIGLLVAAIGLLSLLDTSEILGTSAALTIVFVGLAAMFKSIKKIKTSDMLSSIAELVLTLTAIGVLFYELSSIENPQSIVPIAEGVGIVLLALGASFALLKRNGIVSVSELSGVDDTLKMMLLMLTMVSGAIGLLSLMANPNGIIKEAAAVGIVLVALGTAMRALQVKDFGENSALKNIGTMLSMLAGVSVAIGLLSHLANPDRIIEKALAVSAILVALGAAMKLMSMPVGIKAGVGGTIAVMLSMLVGVSAAIGILSQIPNMENALKVATSMSVLFIAISTGMAILAVASPGIIALGLAAGTIIAASLSISAAIAIMSLVFAGIGALFNIPGFDSALRKAEDVIPRIGGILGGFIGSILGAIVAFVGMGAAAAIVHIGEAMEIFAEHLNSLSGIKVDQSAIDFLRQIGTVILELAIAGILGENILGTLGEQLAIFAPGFVSFCNAMSGIESTDKVFTASQLLGSLAEILANIPLSGGLLEDLIGGKDLSGFGSGLSALATGIADYANIMKTAEIDTTLFENTNTMLKTLISLAESVPLSGELIEFFASHNIGRFGEQLQTFASNFVVFSKILMKNDLISTEMVQRVKNMGDIMLDLANSVPKTGVMVRFFGAHDIGEFGNQLAQYAAGFASFIGILSTVNADEDMVQKVKNCGQMMSDLAATTPPQGGFIGWLLGEQDIGKFGEKLTTFGAHFAGFIRWISFVKDDIDPDLINRVVSCMDEISRFRSSLNLVSSIAGMLGVKDPLEQFARSLDTYGEGLHDFFGNVKDINWEIVSSATDNLSKLFEIIKGFSDVKAFDPNRFQYYIDSLAEISLDKFIDSFESKSMDLGASIYRTIFSALLTAKSLLQKTETDYSFIIDSILAGVDGHDEEIVARAINAAELFHTTMVNESWRLDEAGKALISAFFEGFRSRTEEVEAFVSEFVGSILTWMNETLGVSAGFSQKFIDIGTYCVDGFVKGIDNNSEAAYTKIAELGNKIVSTLEATLGVQSPSRKFAEIGMYSVLGFNQGISENIASAQRAVVKMGETLLQSIRSFWGINSPSTVTRDEVGRYIIEGIAEGITTDMSAEEAASKKAQNIISAFQSEFDKWDLNTNTADLEYQLWESMNPGTSDAEKAIQKQQMLDKKLSYQAERVNAANAQYQATLQALGENAKETQQAYNTYLQEQITMANLASQLIETANGSTNNGVSLMESKREAFRKLGEIYNSVREAMLAEGYTEEEIKEYAEEMSGWSYYKDISTNMGSVASIVENYMSKATGSIDGMVGNISVSIAASYPSVSAASSGLGGAAAGSFSEGFADASEQIEKVFEEQMDNLGLASIIGGDEGSKDFIDLFCGGLSNGTDGVLGVFGSIMDKLVEKARGTGPDAANAFVGSMTTSFANSGVWGSIGNFFNSKSITGDMYKNGQNVVNGYAGGIQDANSVARVKESVTGITNMTDRVARDQLEINSPSRVFYEIGKMIDQGLANGIIDSGTVVERALSGIMSGVQKTIDAESLGQGISKVVSNTVGSSGSSRHYAYGSRRNDDAMAQYLVWDSQGNLVPYGYHYVDGYHHQVQDDWSWWIAPSYEIAHAIREFADSEEARKAMENANKGYFQGTMEDLVEAVKEASQKGDINFTQNNYSPESLSSSTIYRNTQTALAKASAAASPTGQSIKESNPTYT